MFTTTNTEAALLAIPMELERIRSELQAGLAESHNGRPIAGARYLPAGGRGKAWGGSGRLVGWSVRAVGGPVVLVLRDGSQDGAEALAVLSLADGQAETMWLGSTGVSFGEALVLDRSGAGRLDGAVWIGAVD